MREDRSSAPKNRPRRCRVKLLFPMVLFIFPAILVVMAGPAAIRLVQIMSTK